MPELPEVETIKNDLKQKILNKKIKKVEVRIKRIVKSDLNDFLRTIKNNKFKSIERRGKLIILKLFKGNKFLLVHLKMTGQLIYRQGKDIVAGGHGLPRPTDGLPGKYSHVIIVFSDNSRLFFNDMRKFGYMKLVDIDELKKI